MGGGANTFMDESFQGYPHLLDEETGKFSRSTTPGLRVYYPGTMRPIGIGSKMLHDLYRNKENSIDEICKTLGFV